MKIHTAGVPVGLRRLPMHKIGDNIVYGASGVMTVVDVREEQIGDESRKYYVLQSHGGHKDSLTFVPVDNEKLVSAMRPLLSKEKILAIIKDYPEVAEAEWINDNRARAEKFKSIIEGGDHKAIIGVIKAIQQNSLRRGEEGKKNYLSDDAAMRKAEHTLYSEFSIVLGIPEEEVAEMVAKSAE